MNIVYFYTERALEDFTEAYRNVWDLKDRYNIQFALTTIASDYSYWDRLIEYWGQDDLIMIEQDIVPTPQQLDDLIACPDRTCTYYFRNSSLYSGGNPNLISIGCRVDDPDMEIQFQAGMRLPRYVTFSGVGLVKINKYFQRKPLDRFAVKTRQNGMSGVNADNAIIMNVNSWLDGFMKFHVHGEVQHLHR